MIDTLLIELLPEEISDEAAYHLVNFISHLAVALENHYFAQIKRYIEENSKAIDMEF
jgi:hypothetical protein